MVEMEIEVAQPVILGRRFHNLDAEFKAKKSPTTPDFTYVEREAVGNLVRIRYDFDADQLSEASRKAFEKAFNKLIGRGKIVAIRELFPK